MADEFERWSAEARQVLVLAHEGAHRFGHTTIEPDHLLLGFLRQLERSNPRLMEVLAPNLYRLSALVRHTYKQETVEVRPGTEVHVLGHPPRPGQPGRGGPRPSDEILVGGETRRIMALADEEARTLNAPKVGLKHVGLALLRWEGAADRLKIVGVDPSELRVALSGLEDPHAP